MTLNPDQARSLLSSFLDEDGHGFEGVASSGSIPDSIGGYDIVRLLGTGGMGMVFEATQRTTGRQVALKLMRTNIVSTGALRRFEHEVRMLARLHHQGIAQIYEAGAQDGPVGPQPYFAMELVEGPPLTEYAEANQLGVRERLSLFVSICRAVEYAHRRGIIHRDLKPSNILVDRDGAPRILDFGVARTTDTETSDASAVATRTGQLLGTLAYMSPERCLSGTDALDTRSDVYSLGVVLYELLTTRLPYDLEGLGIPAAARRLQEQDPVPPSTIRRELAGDIETILLKVLEKDPDRRYQSAGTLAADIDRYLGDQPILARPNSALYALRKYAKRNKAMAAGLVVAMLGIGAGLVIATWLFAKTLEARADARSQEEAAEVQADAMRAVSLILTELIESADPINGGRDARVVDALNKSDAILSSPLVDHPRIELAMRTTLGRVYLALGDFEDAELHLREALRIGAALLPERDPTYLLARSAFATFLFETFELGEAESLASDVLELQRDSLGSDHADTVETLALLGRIKVSAGAPTVGYRLLEEALQYAVFAHGDDSRVCNGIRLDMARALLVEGHPGPASALANDVYDRQIRAYGDLDPLTIEALIELGHIALEGDVNPVLAQERLWLAYGRANRVLGRSHPVTADALYLLARASFENSDLNASEDFLREAFGARRSALGAEHPETRHALRLLAQVLLEQGLVSEAEPFLELYLASPTTGAEDERTSLDAQRQLADIRFQSGELDSAATIFRRVLDRSIEALGPDHTDTLAAHCDLARVLVRQDKPQEAEEHYLAAIRQWTDSGEVGQARAVAAMSEYARLLDADDRPDAAAEIYQRLLGAAAQVFPVGSTRIGVLKTEYGEFLLSQQDYAQAERYLLDAFATFRGTISLDEPAAQASIDALRRLYEESGQADRARAFERQVSEG